MNEILLHLTVGILKFNTDMQSPQKKIAVLIFAVFHLIAPFVVQLGHTHTLYGEFNSPQQLQSHDCGADELHKKLTPTHICDICLRASQTSAYLPSVFLSFETPFVLHQNPLNTSHSINGFDFSCPKRGPPSFNS